ncbi:MULTISPECIES: AraC family transcriptional regulator [Clostridia]|uniref:AraC family transcriptional regulator n=1 Tax=Clostridia TaxID=186801 RepID=UPI00067F5510|nr:MULTISPECIES: AraC family transcriptional regulator [Clostridia]
MDKLFELSNLEKIFKAEYENGGQMYLNKPMTNRMYKEIISKKRKFKEYYSEIEIHHEGILNDTMGNTIKDVNIDGEYIELSLHGRYSFPLLHNHEYIELIYVYSGNCTHFVEDQSFEMKEGDVCILAPNAMHAISAVDDEAVIINIMMSKKMFNTSFLNILKGEQLLSDFFENVLYNRRVTPYIIFPTANDPWLHQTVMTMYRESIHKDYLFNEIEILYVKQLFIHLIRRYELMAIVSNPINSSPENNIVSVVGYISVNYNHITLHKTAEFFGYNETYLGQMLKKYTGKKFTTLLNEVKLSHAKNLLETSTMSITEIGCEVGFYDSSHFTRKFKEVFGITPKSYRTNLEKIEQNTRTALHS